MYDCRQFFINGEWIAPTGRKESLVINPATEEPVGRILLGNAEDVIFGPALVMIPYADEEEAIRIANDSVYGLSGHIHSSSIEHARRVAARIRTGMIHLNGAARDPFAPFGGYKQSGNGREWGREGFKEFLEIKAVMGYYV
jgi:aldehyde dehydrogenase (NAD+)